MRNLKRVLSLSLASIMLLGMMVIGSSAAQDYTDVDYDNDNVEAIEVLDAINVMRGDLDANGELAGTFRPGSDVKRSEMARIMAFLMDLDYDYYIGANPFNDMVGHWAEKYAAACAATGIIYGRGNGIYDPDATVTAVEAASMLLRALGYFQNPAVDQPNGFVIDTIRQAGRINLFNKVDVKTDEPMTRNDVAQLVLNALQSGMVEPSTSLSVTTPDGFTVSASGTNYVYRVARNDDIGKAINDTKASEGNATDGLMGYVLDLGEQLYQGKLKLDDDLDVFGRPARTWEFDGAKVGTYVKDEQFRASFTTKVTGKDLYDTLTASTIEKYTPVITIDGIRAIPANQTVLQSGDGSYFTAGNLVRSNTEAVGRTEKGVLTEVYVDTLNNIYYISIINTYLAIATQNYNTKDEDVDLRVYGIEAVPTGVTGVTAIVKNTGDDTDGEPYDEILTVENEDIYVEGVEKDDIYLVHIADGVIEDMIIPEVISDTVISSFKLDSWVNNGTRYDYADTAKYDWEAIDNYSDGNLKDLTYNIILDEYGYLIGLERNEDPDQYVFIAGMQSDVSNFVNQDVKMNAIFLDGTMKVITVDMVKSAKISGNAVIDNFRAMGPIVNTWCKYSVNSSGVYTLTVIPTDIYAGDGSVNSKVAQWAQNVADGFSTTADGSLGGGTGDGMSINNSASPTNINASYTIDKGHVSLLGKPTSLDGDSTHTYNRVYGTNNTVYINAELAIIKNTQEMTAIDDGTAANGLGNGLGNGVGGSDKNYITTTGSNSTAAVVIKDVDSFTVGVRNVDTKVYDLNAETWNDSGDTKPTEGNVYTRTGENQGDPTDLAYPKSEIYTLYNKDGDVIAAVTLGVEQGTSAKLAYFYTGNLEHEAYPSNDTTRANGDDWYWSRMALVDGEKVELVEAGSELSLLRSPVKGSWAEVRFDADGYVTRLTPLFGGTDTPTGSVNSVAIINDAEDLEITAESNKTVLLKQGVPSGSLERKGQTLWLYTSDNTSIRVADDVKVLVAWSKLADTSVTPGASFTTKVTNHNKTSDIYVGEDGLKEAIDDLDHNFYGYLNVLVQDQEATVIVLDDRWGTSVDQGSSNTPVVGLDYKTTLDEIQRRLDNGEDVVIANNWAPEDLKGGTEILTINAPASLTVTGNLNLNQKGTTLVISGNGDLTVGKTLYATQNNFENNKIELNSVTVGDMSLTMSGNLTISEDTTVLTTENGVITITGTGNINVEGTLGSKTNTTVSVSGVTMEITNTESLHAKKLIGTSKIKVGSSTKPGKIDVAEIDMDEANGGVELVNIGGDPDNAIIEQVTSGEVDNQTTTDIEIPVVKEDGKLKANAGGKITVTEELAAGPDNIDGDVEVGEEADVTGEALISTTIFFIDTESDYNKMKEVAEPLPDISDDVEGNETLSWLYVLVELNYEDVTKIEATKVTVNGTEVDRYAGQDLIDDDYWEIDGDEVGDKVYFHWEMVKSDDDNTDTQWLDNPEAKSGQVYEVTFEVTIEGKDEKQLVTVSDTYRGRTHTYTAPEEVD